MKIYFDNAATTCVDPEVASEMIRHLCTDYGNPSSHHIFGRDAKRVLEESRQTIAHILNTKAQNIYFTSGATESNNIALKSSIRTYNINHVVTSPLEHPSVLKTLRKMAESCEIILHILDVDGYGNISLDHLRKLLSSHSNMLVSIMHGNNEIGNINDIIEIGNLVKEHRSYFHTDTVQTIGQLKFNLNNDPIDFISGSAHKFHGPKGTGFLYVREGHKLNSLIEGGGQERSLRSGTENVSGIVGMAKALELAHRSHKESTTKILGIKDKIITKIKETIPQVKFNGNCAKNNLSLPNILNFSLPKLSAGSWIETFNQHGIAVSGGSACSGGGQSHVLQTLNVNSNLENVRVSISKYNTIEEADILTDIIQENLAMVPMHS